MSDTTTGQEELELLLKHGQGLVDHCVSHELTPDEIKSTLALTTASVCFEDMDKEDFLVIMGVTFELISSLRSDDAEAEVSLGLN